MANYLFPRSRLLLFAKAPLQGAVKTRLIPHIGATAACRLHQHLILKLLQHYSDAAVAPLEIWYSGVDREGFFQHCRERFDVSVHEQQGEDLGQRMAHAFADSLHRADGVMIVGADCVSLQARHVTDALALVSRRDCVALHPAEDGGYVSISMRRLHRGVFSGIDWGSDQVYAQTRAKAEALSVPLVQLDTLWDLDRYEDLQRSGIDWQRLDINPALG